MTHGRFTLPLALTALTLVSAGTADARARVRTGLDVSSTLPLGSTERIADPAMTGRLKIQLLMPNDRVLFGLVGGYSSQLYRAVGDPTLTAAMIGVEGAYIFGPKDWGTRPFVAFQTGFARLGLVGGAQFSAPSERESGNGWFVIPEAGLTVSLTPRFGLRFDFRYEWIMSFDEMAIADFRTHIAQTFGLGAGVILTF